MWGGGGGGRKKEGVKFGAQRYCALKKIWEGDVNLFQLITLSFFTHKTVINNFENNFV